MATEPKVLEPQSLLEVREWKAKVSEEIERIGFKAYSEKSGEKHAAFWAEIEARRKNKPAQAA